MGSLLEALEARAAAARVRVEELRAEMAALAERLAAEEERLSRLQITKETVIEVLADGAGGLPEDGAVAAGAGAASASQGAAPSQRRPGRGSGPVGRFLPSPRGGDADGRGLPVAYRDVWEVLVDAGRPLRAKQLCDALGVGAEPRHREGMRSKLKRLVRRGWLVEVEPGLFGCAAGRAGVDGAIPAGTPGQVKV